YAISIAISLYCFAGADLERRISGGIGSFSIDRPNVILGAAVVAWLYFLWRYYLAVRSPTLGIGEEIKAEHVHSKTFKRVTAVVLRDRLAKGANSEDGQFRYMYERLSEAQRESYAADIENLISN